MIINNIPAKSSGRLLALQAQPVDRMCFAIIAKVRLLGMTKKILLLHGLADGGADLVSRSATGYTRQEQFHNLAHVGG